MKYILSVVSALIIAFALNAQENSLTIIPQPESFVFEEGSFSLSNDLKVYIPKEFKTDFEAYFLEKMKNDTGLEVQLKTGSRTPSSNFILFEKTDDTTIESEGYTLEIKENSIVAKFKTYAGMFNAFQTLRQVIPVVAGEVVEIPCMLVKDNPRFQWRGMMLDVSRHFRSKEFVLKQIDVFASYKINKFHWHLTDDQGWRIEIKKYPNLTEKGAWRADRTGAWWHREPATANEVKTVGGFYTQQDIKEVIEYARIRNVEIIPEIDVPGHSKALVASYPFLCCVDSANFEVAVGGKAPDNALCAGKESTYEFLDNVLTEIAELFPSEYLHIGGDECNKKNWKECEHCQKVVEANQLKDMEELQSHFIQRVNKLVTAKGKTMIGWDEILSGKGAKGATIMAWRRGAHKPHIEAPKNGYPTIMTDFYHSYLSQVQGASSMEPEGPAMFLPLSKVYALNPIPEELTAEEANKVMGVEACLWAEFTPSDEHSEYMLYPRSLANAEVAWTKNEVKDWGRFQKAVEANFKKLERDDVNYSNSIYNVYVSFALDILSNKAMVYMNTETVGYDIYYTTNGDKPTASANEYQGAFSTKNRNTIKAGLFDDNGKLLGRITELKIK